MPTDHKLTKVESIAFDFKTTTVIVGLAVSIAGSYWNQVSLMKRQNESILELKQNQNDSILELKRTQTEQFDQISNQVNLLIAVNTLEAFRKDPWSGTMEEVRQRRWIKWAEKIDPEFNEDDFPTIPEIQTEYAKELSAQKMIDQLNGW